MDDDPANAVRTRKDASLVRCAEAVRDGRAAAMVGAGNTGDDGGGASRWHRIKGVHRPAMRFRCRRGSATDPVAR
jgi:glycerol-3-phosphate acyltransferase PlsX